MATLPTLPMELFESRESEHADRAGSGTRKWLSTWAGRFASWVPVVKKTLYTEGIDATDISTADSRLLCVRVQRKGVGAGTILGSITLPFNACLITVNYAEVEGFSRLDERFSGAHAEVVNLGPGRTWANGGPCDVPLNVALRGYKWTFTKYLVHSEWKRRQVLDSIDCVNLMPWGGYGRGLLRVMDVDIATSYDESLNLTLDRITYTIGVNKRGWQFRWNNGVWQVTNPLLWEEVNFNAIMGAGQVSF